MSAEMIAWVFWGAYASVGLAIFGLILWWALRGGLDTPAEGVLALTVAGLSGVFWLMFLLLVIGLAPPAGLVWLIGKGLTTLSQHVRAEAKT